MLGAGGGNTAAGKSGMHDAGPLPDLHVLATGLRLDVVAEVDIRKKKNGILGGYGVYNRDGVARRAKDVAFRLHFDRGIDVADNDVIGMAAPEGPHAFDGATIDEAAAG